MVGIVSADVTRCLLGVAIVNVLFLATGGLESASVLAQTGSSSLPPVTVDAPQSRPQRRATTPSQGARARSSSATSRAATASGSEQSPSATGRGSKQNASSDSLKPLGGQLPEPKTPHQITQNISVVERGQIEQTSPTALLDILANIPGVSIARSGGIGG